MWAIASEPACLMPVAADDGPRRVFWRLIGCKGIRGGSISVPVTCGDAFTILIEVLGAQYEVE